ncbi:hypothetical protein Poli38472_014168 [Pythium oligandrum]|uniref:Calponin-homology (CH) domain-containing protein n=1 Tax=Pythium oligandrum TaxID=41045 RepID=A0A8K1FIP4_PYTOL|nr:hypothetical protein Poli38472_014168 [Pythium oligandrum]|eukprot:TMW64051.1 hypothetical protein Poli38472_014168 [Pythium oligandrum]
MRDVQPQAWQRPAPLLSSSASVGHVRPLTASSSVAGSPVNFRRSQSPTPLRKPRPTTALVLSASSTIDALIGSQGESATEKPHVSSLVATPVLPTRQTQWCSGCGAYAELCMACFSVFRKKDENAYKRQLVRSVDVLFARATKRAFTKMAHVVLTWVFGIWRRETRQQRKRRALALHTLHRLRVQRIWRAWQVFLYERHIVGAMLYAEQQQQTTREKLNEIAQLHGDIFEFHATTQVARQLQNDSVETLQLQVATLQRSLDQRNHELTTLRKELHDAKTRMMVLEKQAIDPKELERIQNENADVKKMAFQLASTLMQSMETQMEVLASNEGRQNLNNVLSKEVVQLLDKPEHAGFYNPLVELEAPAKNDNFLASYDAPVDRADRILLQWVNALVQKQPVEWLGASKITNFSTSLADGKAFVVLTKVLHAAMSRVRPKRPPGMAQSKLEVASVLRGNGEDLTEIAMERYADHVKRESLPEKRLELMIGTIGQALWMPQGLLNAKDVLAGDAELNFATLTYFFCTYSPCLDETFYALCNDLKLQVSSTKAKWRELRESLATITTHPMDEASSLTAKMKLALAQTLDIKKRLDSEDQRAREGHVLWWKSIRIVLRKCFFSYARLARGKAGLLSKIEATQDENEAFAKLPRGTKLLDLAQPYEDMNWESKLLQSYLLTVYCDLARIYRGYAMRVDVANHSITFGDLLEMLTECRVVDASFTAADVHTVFRKVDTKLTGNVSTSRPVTPLEYIEALLRVGRRKYTAEHHRITLSESFCLLVDNCILPFAFRSDADIFRKQLEDPKIRRLLLKFADELRDLYARYAVEREESGAQALRKRTKRPRMSAFAFSQCLLDKNVQDVTLNSEKVLAVVQRVARTAKKELEGGAGTVPGKASDEDELTYDEFQEAMVVIACYKFPDPYISLESRLEKFLTFYLRGGPTATASGLAIGES